MLSLVSLFLSFSLCAFVSYSYPPAPPIPNFSLFNVHFSPYPSFSLLLSPYLSLLSPYLLSSVTPFHYSIEPVGRYDRHDKPRLEVPMRQADASPHASPASSGELQDQYHASPQHPILRRALSAGNVCQEMMEVLKDELSRMRRHHVASLLQPSVTHFSISGVSDHCSTLNIISLRAQRLKRLDLSYMKMIRPPAFIRLIPTLAHIVVLNLRMTETTDQILGLIGQHCPELRELDISNTAISEVGLTRLCYDTDTDRPMCQKLVKLSILGCYISARPVSFLLQYIPTLREIDYDNIFEAFGVMKDWGLTLDNIDSCDKYHLRILNSVNEIVDPLDVHIAITLCPYVTNFTLSNAYVDNEVLYKVMMLDNLTHLRITNNEAFTLNFQEGILPVLTVKGHQLLSLLLANFTSVDISAIGECCPRLQNLALSNISIYDEIMYPREHYFTCLTGLEVWADLQVDTMNPTILKQLLSYCHGLQKLLVRNTDALSDKLLFDIWRENKMQHLFRLTIDNCPNVTASSIHQLLDMCNDLTLVRLWSCFFISKDDYQKLRQRIKNENCDLYLEWFGWTG